MAETVLDVERRRASSASLREAAALLVLLQVAWLVVLAWIALAVFA
jgi:hypothetical protein